MGIFDIFRRKKNNDVEELAESLERESKNKIFVWNVKRINEYVINEQLAWYSSNSNILLEFYTASNMKEYPTQYLFYRNCANYFWAQSAKETKIKRTTAGVYYSIIKILTDIVGIPKLKIYGNEQDNKNLEFINKQNKFLEDVYYAKQLPLTAVEGWGAYRIDIDTLNEKCPRIRYYDGRNCAFEEENGEIKKIRYYDYFLLDGKEYLLIDDRYMKDQETSVVEKKVYLVNNDKSLIEMKLSEFPNLKDQVEYFELKVPFILGVPCRWYEMVDTGFSDGIYGRPLFYGKIDSLDDYDQAVSIAATTIRRSTPKVSYPVDSLETDKFGNAKVPDRFDLEYIEVPSHITGDGKSIESQGPKVVQPNVVIDIYTKEQDQILNQICSGIISVGELGMNKNAYLGGDSGTALRERNKQTLFTRNLICNREQRFLKEALNISLYMYDLLWNNSKPKKDYDIEVLYDKFSIPSKEERVKVYLPMFQSGAISDEMFISNIYDDDLSDEDKAQEVAKIKQLRLEKNNVGDSQKVPEVERTTSPYEAEDRLDKQSGMNNYNRGVKNVKNI